MECGAAPSSLLLVRISPSVIIVKRPCARETTSVFVPSGNPPMRAAIGPAPPVNAGAVTRTEPSARRRMAIKGMSRSLSGSAGNRKSCVAWRRHLGNLGIAENLSEQLSASIFVTLRHAIFPSLGWHGLVGRQLQDDLPAIIEDEAAVLAHRQVGRELARPPQAAGEQQRG